MTVREALREGQAALAGSETPFLDASLLLADCLSIDTTRLLASGPDELDPRDLGTFRGRVAERSRGMPVAYILGRREFWGRRFLVDRRVLVPRPDTEILVEAALRIGDARSPARGAMRVFDACTGSGCVAVSLAADRPEWRLSASDISPGALEVALANAEALLDRGRPGGPIEFSVADLLDSAGGGWDLVVSNPPYVESEEAARLLGLGWSEPAQALDGGPDGLDLVRRLVPQARDALAPGGALVLEADPAQAAEIADLFRASGFEGVETLPDLAGRPRVSAGRTPWKI